MYYKKCGEESDPENTLWSECVYPENAVPGFQDNVFEVTDDQDQLTVQPIDITAKDRCYKKYLAVIGTIVGSLIAIVIILIAVIIINSRSDSLSDSTLRKIMQENGYDAEMVENIKIVDAVDLGENIDGLNGENALVLVKNGANNRYACTAVNFKDRRITDSSFGYAPLNIIISEIFNASEDINIANLEKISEYIEKYGFECFNNQEYAEKYIRDITGSNGFYDAADARNAILNSIEYIFPDIKTAEDYTVIFEEDNANPIYYAVLDSGMVYNWNSIFAENVYKVWEANTDLQTQRTMEAIYGPPYVSKQVWAAVDKNMNEVGTFSSEEAMRKKLSASN